MKINVILTRNHTLLFSENDAYLFSGNNTPVELVFGWTSGKNQFCRDQIWAVCSQLLVQGISIVLDGTALNKEQRALIRQKAIKSNVDFQLYYITADRDIRRNRVFERNAEKGKTFSIGVST